MGKRIWLIVVLLFAVAAAGIWYLRSNPGSLTRLTDYDPALTAMAQSALPIIGALDKYRAMQGDLPNLKDTATINPLVPLLPGDIVLKQAGEFLMFDRPPTLRQWLFSRTPGDPNSYSLSLKLGWDAKLIYRRNGDKVQWMVDPGDGTPARLVQLKP